MNEHHVKVWPGGTRVFELGNAANAEIAAEVLSHSSSVSRVELHAHGELISATNGAMADEEKSRTSVAVDCP